jgi:phospholipase/carboxylesterase
METLGFIHRFEEGRPEERPLLLLHGTGGDEDDLIPLARMIAPTASLLSPRGKVLENGMPRFFRRLAEGVFDEDDVRRRANELADFVRNARARYDMAPPIALGGASCAAIGVCRCNPAASDASFGTSRAHQIGWRPCFNRIRRARSHHTV